MDAPGEPPARGIFTAARTQLLRPPVLWGVVFGAIQAASPLGFGWLSRDRSEEMDPVDAVKRGREGQSRWFTMLSTLPSGARTKNRRTPHGSVVIGCTIS